MAKAMYDAVVARYSSPATAALGLLILPYLFPELSAFATVEDLVTHLRTSNARYRSALPAEFLDRNPPPPPMYITLCFIVTRLPDSLRAVRDHFLALDPIDLTVDLLKKHLLAAETSVVAVGAARGTPRTPFFEGCSPSPLAPSYASTAAVDILGAEDVGAASALSGKRRSSKGKGGRSGAGGSGGGGGGGSGGGGGGGGGGSGGSGGGSGGYGGGGGGSGGGGGGGGGGSRSGGGGSGGGRGGAAQRGEFGDEPERPRCAEGDCYLCVPPDPGIEAAALCASESAPFGTAPAEALHTFTLDSGASHCFFRDSTTLTPVHAPVPVRLADPSGGPVLAHSSTFLMCPAVLSGLLSGLHLPLFSTNLVSTVALQDAMVTTTTPGGQRVSICTCTRTSRHLATFTRRPGSNLYTLTTKPPQVAASAQVSASCPVAPPCSCRLLTHQTLLWHRCLAHPSMPCLHGMHSRLLVSGLPRSLPPLPPSPAPPCLPCDEGLQRTAPQSSSFPSTIAPLQTLHMDVWGPARVSGPCRERYFLLVVDDYTRYTTVFPLRSKGEVPDVLIHWIRAVRLQLCERFREDLPVLRLHSDRGGEFSSDLLRDFCRGEGILRSFTLLASPQKNGVAECRIGLVMEVARTSMIHAAAPYFLWSFAVRDAAHQLNLWPRVSLPETSPTLRWMGKVGDALVFWAWGSRAFVRDNSTDKLSARAIPYVFLSFPPDAHGLQFYHPFSRRGPAPSGVSQVEPLPGIVPVEVAVDSSAARGAASGGAEPASAEPGGAKPEGAESGGAVPGGAEPGGTGPEGAEPGASLIAAAARVVCSVHTIRSGAAGAGGSPAGGTGDGASGAGGVGDSGAGDPRAGGAGAGGTGAGGAGASSLGGDGVTAGARGIGGAGAAGPGGARTRGARAGGTGAGDPGAGGAGAGGAGAGSTGGGGTGAGGAGVGDTGTGGGGAGASRAGDPGTGVAGARGTGARGVGAGGAGAGDPGAGGAGAGGAGVGGTGAGGTVQQPPFFVPPLPSSLPPPDSVLRQPDSPLPALSPYAEQTTSFTKCREPESRPASPVCVVRTGRRIPRPRPPPVLGTHIMALRSSSVPLRDFECLAAAVPHLMAMLLAPEGDPDAPDIPTPRSYEEAIMGPYSSQWQTAMDAKMASWKSTGTYAVTVPPSGANLVDGMWIFRVKRPPGSPPVFKALLLHVAAQRDYELHSLDFSTTFLQGSLHEEIWLPRPPGFTGSFLAGTQWSIPRPVYGLRQAPREWHDTQRMSLAALGFDPSTADPSLFLCTDTSLPPFYVLLYVDDLVSATADTEALALVKSELKKRHTCTDVGELRSYLGLQITGGRARHTINLTQSHMVHQVLQRFGFRYSSPQSTPLPTGHSLSAPPSDEPVEPSGPVLGYLCSTSGMRLVLGGRGPVVLTGHADASWVDDLATQRSSQGYTFSLGSRSVSWRSTCSSSVLSSSCEAEIYAGAMAAQELRWLTYLLTDLGEWPRSSQFLYVDNKAMIALFQEHRLEHKTKHIALRYFLARELQQRGQLRLAYVATRANTTDIFTKALHFGDHQHFCTVLGLVPTLPHLLTA
ncbi:unnamed protein product [Closterium sp. NIES-54]